VVAGRLVLERKPAGLRLAKLALVATAGVKGFAGLTPYFPSNSPPGWSVLFVGVTVIYTVTWLVYLVCSRQVARTFTDARVS
jgi:hypothetical protein